MTAKGSVSKYQAKPGKRGVRWRFRLDVGTTGRRRQVSRAGFATEAEAEAALEKHRALYVGVTVPSAATLGAYMDGWVEHRLAVGKIRPATANQYDDTLRLLGDDLRAVPLLALTATHLDRRYADLLAPRGDGRRRSARTVRMVYSALHAALGDAVKKGTLVVNVAAASDPPSAAQSAASERAVWNADDGLAFLNWDGLELSHQAAWTLVMYAGLRRAEACGLRWSDIVDGELRVVRTRSRGRTGDVVIIGEPKTLTGRRTVPLPQPALDTLAEWRRRHAETMLAIGERFDEVLLAARGAPWHPDRLSRAWRRDVDRAVEAGVVPHRMTMHDGRHWYGSHLVSVGVDLRTVSEMMGHADPSFTLRTYAHSDDDRKRAAAALAGLSVGRA